MELIMGWFGDGANNPKDSEISTATVKDQKLARNKDAKDSADRWARERAQDEAESKGWFW
jgi:hypothetical protein